MKKQGKIILTADVVLQEHELKTASFFAARGNTIEFLARRYDKGIKIPDIKMDGINWEIKAPQSNGKYTIIHALKKALKQSKYIIFDLRRSKMYDSKSIAQLTNQFKLIYEIKRLLIITKSNKLLDFKK